MVLLKGPTFTEFSMKYRTNISLLVFSLERPQVFAKFSMPYGYARPYVYSFCQIFQAQRLFPALLSGAN